MNIVCFIFANHQMYLGFAYYFLSCKCLVLVFGGLLDELQMLRSMTFEKYWRCDDINPVFTKVFVQYIVLLPVTEPDT
jgi:hypothetical protein